LGVKLPTNHRRQLEGAFPDLFGKQPAKSGRAQSTNKLTPTEPSIRQQVKDRDAYWSDLMLNMVEGRIADVAALQRLSMFEFYNLYQAWVKRNEAIIAANKQQ